MWSPDSLMDAEGDVDSDFGEASYPETDPAGAQDSLCNMQALDGSQAGECASQTTESCLREHPVALIASQTGEKLDPAMDQALASALEPEASKASLAAAAITSTPDRGPEPRTSQSPSPSRRVTSANAQDVNTQPMTHEHGLGGELSVTEERPGAKNESIADHQDDQGDGHVASTSLNERDASTGNTSPILQTASHSRHASNDKVTHENIDLSSSSSEDEEPSESIIIDTNGGEAIVIDSTDEEMYNDTSYQIPPRRMQRKPVSPRSREMVDWTSREYKKTSAASLTAAWEKVWKRWGKIHAQSDRLLKQILDYFHEEMSDIQRYELWNDKYRKHDGRRAYRIWVNHGIEKRIRLQLRGKEFRRLGRRLGRALKQLQEVEEEHQSITVTMKDGDREDCDYVPAPTRRHRKKRFSV
ncbi:hypothetical protein PMIN04_012012 [Paraphaeosphaeria minitans]|uniref:Uncharacterized protein n=1 Tax=Paraphaeosphaeria minitans TaxID=565426 RepID=A0A9P6G6X7_9PLEO|nr:hypothetical protein PMIN01_12150 [Paraphaeosphaeria minitans]